METKYVVITRNKKKIVFRNEFLQDIIYLPT